MLGTTKSSGKFMAKYLAAQNWLDRDTTLLFFEQTYLNIPFNTFYLVRASFQFAEGGFIESKMRITQVTDDSSLIISVSYAIFVAYLAVQFYQIIKMIKQKKLDLMLLLRLVMFAMDLSFVCLSIRNKRCNF